MLAQGGVAGSRVRHPVPLLGDRVATRRTGFERQGKAPQDVRDSNGGFWQLLRRGLDQVRG